MQKETIGYLGPAGTFSDQAARLYGPTADYRPYDSIPLCVAALRRGEIDTALVPIDNSFGGSINETVDSVIRFADIVAYDEFLLRVELNLIGAGPIEMSAITEVLSHAQPLAQCRDFLETTLPYASRKAVASTAMAVESLSPDAPTVVAVGTEIAAQLYGHVILARQIEDHHNNTTRFVALRKEPVDIIPPTGDDRTMLVFSIPDEPGSLVRALGVFDALNVNMYKIESRPLTVADRAAEFGRAIFRIDIEGHQLDDNIRIALQALEKKVVSLRVAGSHPRRTVAEHGE